MKEDLLFDCRWRERSGSQTAMRMPGQEDLLPELPVRKRDGIRQVPSLFRTQRAAEEAMYVTGTEYVKYRPTSVHRVPPKKPCT